MIISCGEFCAHVEAAKDWDEQAGTIVDREGFYVFLSWEEGGAERPPHIGGRTPRSDHFSSVPEGLRVGGVKPALFPTVEAAVRGAVEYFGVRVLGRV